MICTFFLYAGALMNLFIISNNILRILYSFWCIKLCHLWLEIVLLLSFQSECLFSYFPCLVRPCTIMLNKSVESGHQYFVPSIREKAFNLSPLNMLAMCFHKCPLSGWESSLLFLLFSLFLSWKDIGFGAYIFYSLIERIMFFFLYLIHMMY